jgi:integrase
MIEEGNLDVKKGSEGYLRLAAGVLKAQIHLLQVDRMQSTGDYSYQFKEPIRMPQDEPETTSEIILKVATEYWDEKSPSWSPRTVPDYRIFKDTLLDFLGKNTMIHSVDYDNGRDYKAHLDTLKNAKGKPLSDSRKDSYLGFAKQLWKWAIQHHYADTNPFDGLQVGKAGRKRADKQRAAFTQDDLKTIFCDSKEYGQDRITRPDYFWVPLLGLYTGCRLEEICQAYVKDIKEEEGVWILDVVADEPDKRIKTGERRLVSLHDTLIDLGFLNYAQSLPKNDRLFPKSKRIGGTIANQFITNRLVFAKSDVPVHKAVRAESFELVDKEGKLRASLWQKGGETGLMIGEPLKEHNISIVQRSDYADISLSKLSGKQIKLTVSDEIATIHFGSGRDIVSRILIGVAGDGSPSIVFSDNDGKLRLFLGRTTLVNKKTGSKEIRPEGSVVIFNKEGSVIGALP